MKLDLDWDCPQCGEPLNTEEVSQVRAMIKGGQSKVELRCDECGEPLIADNSECAPDEVNINEEWVYD